MNGVIKYTELGSNNFVSDNKKFEQSNNTSCKHYHS